ISNDYYPALDKPNVDVITTGIREVRPHSVVTTDGVEREVDAIIFGTGFAATDPFPKGLIFGRDGLDITNAWKDGPEAYKGTTVANFPNFFLLMGPNTGLAHSSMVYMIESQINYVLDALSLMDRKQLAVVEVMRTVQERYNQQVQGRLGSSVWNRGGCQSWYIHPVSGKNTSLWPGYTWRFRQITRKFDAPAYQLVPVQRQQPASSSVSSSQAA